MKLSSLNCVLTLLIGLVVPWAGSSQDITPSRLHVAAGTDRAALSIAADSIVKEDGARYDSLIHLKGNVEIRTCCVQLPARNQIIPGDPNPPQAYMIMSADEADYDGEAGKIEARGVVRVTFQNRN